MKSRSCAPVEIPRPVLGVGGNINNYELALNVPRYDPDKLVTSSPLLADLIERRPPAASGQDNSLSVQPGFVRASVTGSAATRRWAFTSITLRRMKRLRSRAAR